MDYDMNKDINESLAIEAIEKMIAGLDCEQLLVAHNLRIDSKSLDEIKAIACLSLAWKLLDRPQTIKNIRLALSHSV